MAIWGVSALSHDAAIAVIEGPEILFAAHSERYSRKKNDPLLSEQLVAEAMGFGAPEAIAWYERPLLKKVRHLAAGQLRHAVDVTDLPRRYLGTLGIGRGRRITYVPHHLSHALGGVYCSNVDDAAVIVADAIGEFETFSIGHFSQETGFRRIRSVRYPDSLGLLYSAFTRRCGLKPNEEEYILMGMAAFGRPIHVDDIFRELIELEDGGASFRLRKNVHRGIGDWLPNAAREDLAASIQEVTEHVLTGAAAWAAHVTGSRSLILGGGVALNCVANSAIARLASFDHVWILPNPGDAGSSVGAAAALGGRPLSWRGPYLGTAIDREVDVDKVVDQLDRTGIVALAHGRAEFGPRALGNRSILADPRSPAMKDRVNQIKGRERFRPFAPVIREELADTYFDMPVAKSPYMQFTAECRQPDVVPAVVHVDNTSRVQTVNAEENSLLYEILVQWERRTGCAMLLNTSLNSRGQPLVNTWEEAVSFGLREHIEVF